MQKQELSLNSTSLSTLISSKSLVLKPLYGPSNSLQWFKRECATESPHQKTEVPDLNKPSEKSDLLISDRQCPWLEIILTFIPWGNHPVFNRGHKWSSGSPGQFLFRGYSTYRHIGTLIIRSVGNSGHEFFHAAQLCL